MRRQKKEKGERTILVEDPNDEASEFHENRDFYSKDQQQRIGGRKRSGREGRIEKQRQRPDVIAAVAAAN